MFQPFVLLLFLGTLSACAVNEHPAPSSPVRQPDSSRMPEWLRPDLYPHGAQPAPEPVVRYGRYTLVSTEPTAEQRDLLAQIIDVAIPKGMSPTVRDAMEYVLQRSGYRLCPRASGPVDVLYTRPLPAAHYQLGPMTLRNALQVLAGPAWQVQVDEMERTACFVSRPGYQLAPVRPTGSGDSTVQALPAPIEPRPLETRP